MKGNNKKPAKFFASTLKRLDYKKSMGLAHFSESSDEMPEDEGQNYYHKAKLSVTGSTLSKSSHQKKLSTLFHAALDTKYYSRVYRGFFWLFYLSLLVLVILRIILKETLDDKVEALAVKKDIFSLNGLRNYQLIDTSGLTRFIWQFYSGALNVTEYGPVFAGTLFITKLFLLYDFQNLRASNTRMRQASSILSAKAHDVLYERNIKVYDTYFNDPEQTFTMMDSFQATDRIIETGLDLYDAFRYKESNAAIGERANFVFRNSLNDLVLANTQTSAIMQNSFQDQLKEIKELSVTFAVFLVAFLLVLFVISLVILRMQYTTEVFHVSAVCRLNHPKLQAIHKEFVDFQNYLKEDDVINETTSRPLYTFHAGETVRTSNKNHVKRENIKAPEHKGIRRKFFLHLFRLGFVLLILILFVLLNFALSKGPREAIEASQGRLFFVNGVRIRMAETSTTFRELTATNNTAYVENMQALTRLVSLTEMLSSMKSGIYDILLDERLMAHNPQIETLLLGNGCGLLNSTFGFYCWILNYRGVSSGLINLMNEFENYLDGKLEDYKSSNKSMEALKELQIKDYDMISVIYTIAVYEMNYLIDVVDEQFTSKVEVYKKTRFNYLIIMLVITVFFGIIAYIRVLKKLGESVNEFKNILRVFPGELVLASWILKKFLMKTSKGSLDHVRHDI